MVREYINYAPYYRTTTSLLIMSLKHYSVSFRFLTLKSLLFQKHKICNVTWYIYFKKSNNRSFFFPMGQYRYVVFCMYVSQNTDLTSYLIFCAKQLCGPRHRKPQKFPFVKPLETIWDYGTWNSPMYFEATEVYPSYYQFFSQWCVYELRGHLKKNQ